METPADLQPIRPKGSISSIPSSQALRVLVGDVGIAHTIRQQLLDLQAWVKDEQKKTNGSLQH